MPQKGKIGALYNSTKRNRTWAKYIPPLGQVEGLDDWKKALTLKEAQSPFSPSTQKDNSEAEKSINKLVDACTWMVKTMYEFLYILLGICIGLGIGALFLLKQARQYAAFDFHTKRSKGTGKKFKAFFQKLIPVKKVNAADFYIPTSEVL